MDEEIFELHADVCRTLSNPKRLKISMPCGTGKYQSAGSSRRWAVSARPTSPSTWR